MVQVSQRRRSARSLNRIQNPRTGRQADDPRMTYLAHDVHQQDPGNGRKAWTPLRCEGRRDCPSHEADWWAVCRRSNWLGLGGRVRPCDTNTEHQRRSHEKEEHTEHGKTSGSRAKTLKGHRHGQDRWLRRDSAPMTAAAFAPLRRDDPR